MCMPRPDTFADDELLIDADEDYPFDLGDKEDEWVMEDNCD